MKIRHKNGNHYTDDKLNHLAAAEMDEESNYNMVGDGIINNVPKPSVLERMAEYERRMAEHRKAEAEKGGNEDAPELNRPPARDAI